MQMSKIPREATRLHSVTGEHARRMSQYLRWRSKAHFAGRACCVFFSNLRLRRLSEAGRWPGGHMMMLVNRGGSTENV
jgi:hypothetical protein